MGPFPTRKVFFLVIGACLFAFLLPAPTPGQLLQGSMTGNVVDPSGAAAPDAEVSALNTQTGLSRSAFTNDVGQYSFPNLDAGAYDVTVAKERFRAHLQQAVIVTIDSVTRVDVTLQIGQVTEQITVTAGSATL